MLTKFDLRLVRYAPGAASVGPVHAQTLALTLPLDDPAVVSAQVSTAVYGTLPAVVEVAAEYWSDTASDWVEPPNCRFLLNTDDDETTDPAGVHVLNGTALIPWLLGKAIVENPSDLAELVDGHRAFNSATPGAILKTIIDEEQALGWAPYVAYDFDADDDSDGTPWASQLTIQYRPGTTAWQVIRNLLDQGVVEMRTEGRTLRLFNPERGVDRTGGNTPTRIGGTAETIPAKRNLNDLLTDGVLFGDNGFTLEVNNPAAVTELGALRTAIQQAGVSDEGTATLLVQAALTRGANVREQITANEAIASAASLPWEHYEVGDWVELWLRGDWAPLRVAELVLRKNASGVIIASPVLNDRFLDLLARLARRTAGIVGGAVAGGTGAVPSTEDRRKPKPPTGLVVSSTGYWSPAGVPLSQIAAECSPVVQGENDVAIGVAAYEWWARPDDGATDWAALTTTETAAVTWSPFQPETDWLVKVRARSSNGVWGEFSDEESVTMELPTEDLGAPTVPLLASYNGVVEVRWDGLLATLPPTAPPAHFLQLRVEFSATEVGTYSTIGTLFLGQQRASFIGLGVGAQLWFRFVAVDELGRESAPGDPASITVVGIDGADLLADTVTANAIVSGSIETRHIAAGVGGQIDLSANDSILLVVGQIEGVADDLGTTAGELTDLRTYYDFSEDGAIISKPGSPFQVAVRADRIEMLESGVSVSHWTAGQMFVRSLIGTEVVLGNHKLEADPLGTGTVVRAL